MGKVLTTIFGILGLTLGILIFMYIGQSKLIDVYCVLMFGYPALPEIYPMYGLAFAGLLYGGLSATCPLVAWSFKLNEILFGSLWWANIYWQLWIWNYGWYMTLAP